MSSVRPSIFALRSPKIIHVLPGEHGEIFGRVDVGWEKVACWSTKAAISLKRIKIEENLLWRAYRKSPTLFWMVPHLRPPMTSSFPRLGFSTPTKTPIAVISGTAKATHFKFSMHIQKLFRALIYKAHHVVIFAIAELFCFKLFWILVHLQVIVVIMLLLLTLGILRWKVISGERSCIIITQGMQCASQLHSCLLFNKVGSVVRNRKEYVACKKLASQILKVRFLV